jgi:hypothetical protein
MALEHASWRLAGVIAQEHEATAAILSAIAIVYAWRADDDHAGIDRDRCAKSDVCNRRVPSELRQEANGGLLLSDELKDPRSARADSRLHGARFAYKERRSIHRQRGPEPGVAARRSCRQRARQHEESRRIAFVEVHTSRSR